MSEGLHVWRPAELVAGGDRKWSVVGAPRRIDSPYGPALAFDGAGDALFRGDNPLVGLGAYTVEMVFRPDAGGLTQQRFLHLGEADGDRLLFETRLTDDGMWFLDTFLLCGKEHCTLLNRDFLHPVDRWYHLAMTCDGRGQANFVDGVPEQSGPIDYVLPVGGRTSIGVRLNRVCWFKGAVYEVRLTPRVLRPDEFGRP